MPGDAIRQVTKRLRYIEGQAQGIQRMLADGRPSDEVLAQLRAVESAAAGARELYVRHLIERDLLHELAERLTSFGEQRLSAYDIVSLMEDFYSEPRPDKRRRRRRALAKGEGGEKDK